MPTRALLTLFLFASVARADDWPQYRGPNRDDISKETGLLKSWPAGGPKLFWTYADTGAGYSGPAVVGNRLFITGARSDSEFLIALDVSAAEPKQLWATRVGPTLEWKGNVWSSGPSATPTVDGELVYALGGNGDLLCASATDGTEVWRSALPTDLAAEVNPIGGGPKKLGWGFTFAPLVDGDRLVCLPGGPKGTVAALDKRTGKALWRSTELTDQAAYTSPMLAEIAGVRQYVVLTNQSVAGVAADTGKLLWRVQRKFGTEVINSPVVRGNHVFVTVGAGGGCELLKIDKTGDALAASVVYSNKNLVNHHGNVVLLGDHLYGHSQGRGWTCLNFLTGEPAWAKRDGPRAGAITYADGAFYQLAESDGTVTLTAATPTETKDLAKFKLPQQSKLKKPKGGLWTPPVVANGRLYLRDQELLFCYDVKDAK